MMKPFNPVIDNTAQRFLGNKPVHVMEGQKANAQKVQDVQEKYLIAEAKQFGDALVQYVGMHQDIAPRERAWATMLSVLNLRRDYPDGAARFDDVVDVAFIDLNQKIQLPPTTVEPRSTQPQPIDVTAAAEFSERFTKYITMKKQQMDIANPQAAYGIGYAFHTLRGAFPAAEGGVTEFDSLAENAANYFCE